MKYLQSLMMKRSGGNHQGQYPVENKSVLESAAKDLESLAERIKSGSITDMTQEIYDEAIAAADKEVEEVEDYAWPDNSQITWNLFVDGNAGSYIDFGYSEDYAKFGVDDNQAFTIELWVNIKEYCNKQGEDNCTFLSTMTNDPYWSGWRAQDRTKGLLRTMVAHWQDNNQIHKNGNRDGKSRTTGPKIVGRIMHSSSGIRDCRDLILRQM